MKLNDLTGLTFGRLYVLERAGSNKWGNALWRCKCSCGKETVVNNGNLRAGNTRSCGCLYRESTYIHDLHGTPEYHTWQSMNGRCHNPNNQSFDRYGGRGISVCDRWRYSFVNFLADMGKRPTPDHSIDRINNDGNYEPGNCHWATKSEQSRNTRSNRLLTHDGQTLTLTEWAEIKGINRTTLEGRLIRGWPVDRALTEPVQVQFSPRK